MFLYLFIRFKDQVNQDWPAVTIERDRVLIISLPEHFRSGNPGKFLDSPVPCNHLSFAVNGKCRIREKIDDIGQPFLRFMEISLCLSFIDCLPDLVHQFHKLGLWVPAFLEVKISPVVHGFDDHFLAAPAGEEDKRQVSVLLAGLLLRG